MSLSALLSEIESHKPASLMDPTIGPYETSVGRQGMKRNAQEKIKQLKLQYRKELTASSVFIIVTGQNRQAFCDMASNESFECFSVDSEALYRDLVSRVDNRLFGHEKIHNFFNILSNCLEDKALELDLQSYNSLAFRTEYSSIINTPEDLVGVLKRAINDQVGSELVGINAIHSIVDKAIERKHAAAITPVVLNCPDETLALVLNKDLKRLTSRVFLVSAGRSTKSIMTAEGVIQVKNASEDHVGSALTTIRSNLR
jgi:hypothetical protein